MTSHRRRIIAAPRQLLILRHAKSSWDDPKLPDHARPLNPRGRKAAVAMRKAMAKMQLVPDTVLVSSSRRTLQTLEMLQPWPTAPRIQPMDTLYLANVSQLLDVLRHVEPTARTVLLIGHNPGMHELAVQLVGPGGMAEQNAMTRRLAEGYPTGALAVFSIAIPWSDLGAGQGMLQYFFGPRDLPELAA
jgi:phosphohistidine phosphatase